MNTSITGYVTVNIISSLCFIDLEKAFDRLRWDKLMNILKAMKVDWKDRPLMKELYKNQKTSMKVTEDVTEWFDTGR